MLRKKYANELRGIEQLLFFLRFVRKEKERETIGDLCVCLDTRALSGKRRERTETSCLIGSTSFQQQEKKWGGGMAKFKNKKGEKNYRFS